MSVKPNTMRKRAKAAFLSEMPGRFPGRKEALLEIDNAPKPNMAVKRLVKQFRSKGIYKGATALPTSANENANTGDLLIYQVPLSKIGTDGAARHKPRRVEKATADPYANALQLSDLQLVRARLLKKRGGHGWTPTDPQGHQLHLLECDIAQGLVEPGADFNARVAAVETIDDGWNVKAYHAAQEKILAEGKQNLFSGNTLPRALQMGDRD